MTKKSEDKAEKIGFHKGSLATLTKEREEMLRILQIVEQLMQMHIKELKDLLNDFCLRFGIYIKVRKAAKS